MPTTPRSLHFTLTATGSTWADVNGDGLRDELIPEGGASYDFNSFPAETGREFVSTVTWNWPAYFWFGIATPDMDRRWTFYLSGSWQPLIEFNTVEIDLVRPGYQFRTEPGYEYSVVSKLTLQNGTTAYATLIPRTEFVPASALASAIQQEVLLGSMIPAEMLNFSPIFLARIALPPAGVQLNLPIIGNVTLRAGSGGVTGTVVLPGNIKITAGNGSASITAPGVGTLSVNSGGVVTGTIGGLPGGYVLTGSSNGQITLTGPGGASLTSTPGGGTTLTLPGGMAVTVNSSGSISLSVAGGTGALVQNALDDLGRLLGLDLGTGNVRGQVVPPGGQPTQGGWGDIRNILLGDRPPGVYDILTTTDTRGVPESVTPPAPGNIIRITLTVTDPAPPAPALKSRDRFLTGSFDTSGSFYRVNDLEFINTTTGENLGTFRLDGSPGTHVYNSEDDILSDAENDAVLADSLTSGSQQLSQPVVFWRQAPGSSVIRFSTVFNAVGAVQIRVKKSDGALLHTVSHTLTAEPNFGGLLGHLDARIRSLDMPAVAPWSLLPPIEGIDDDDYTPAASTPATAASSQSGTNSNQPAVAATGWQTNFLIKVATTADTALSSPEYSNRLQYGTGEIRGTIDGVWDGLVSDVSGVAELAKLAWDTAKGDFTRAKTIRDGIKALWVTVTDKASRDQLTELMFEKFVAKTQAAVPWAFSEDSALWGLDAYAYMYGYIRGFAAEQVGVAMLGAGIVSKAGLVMKGATESAKLAQLTAAMVSRAQRFTTAAYLAASRRVAKYGDGTMRAVRKALAEVGKQSIDGVTTVAEQMAILVERLGTEGVTWQKIADNAFALCVNEAEVLRVGITLYPQTAKLQFRLGNLLSKSATEGFLGVWARRGQQGMLGECVHYLYEGFETAAPLTPAELARFLEIANGTLTNFTASGVWRLHPFARGFALEPWVARILGAELLAPGFKIIDIWKATDGLVVSIKSLDVTAQTYQTISALTRKVDDYVDLVSTYVGQPTLYGGVIIQPFEILRREVQLVIRPGASAAQVAALNTSVQRAASLQKPVTLVIREIP